MTTDKLGLALSGGGLRASFFHLGVLAHLAERNLLARIETISAVSGGSIAAVPGFFPPIVIEGLYRDGEDPICVTLVDGGVHDNQGIDALLAERCTRSIVSDASGQMDFDACPEPGRLSVLARSGSVLQDQVRYDCARLARTAGGPHQGTGDRCPPHPALSTMDTLPSERISSDPTLSAPGRPAPGRCVPGQSLSALAQSALSALRAREVIHSWSRWGKSWI